MYKMVSALVQQVMRTANQDSERRGADYLDTGDMLVALLRHSGFVSQFLEMHGVSVDPLKRELKLFDGHDFSADGEPYSKAAITTAMTEAYRLNHSVADGEHLLFGLLSCDQSFAVRAVVNLGVDVESLRRKLAISLQGIEEYEGRTSDGEASFSGKHVPFSAPAAPECDRNSGWWKIPELDELETGRAIVRIPAEQNVPLTPRVRAIIDTPQFQRLSEISQLGLVAKVYPGARHTRFEHSLGVYHNCLLYLRQLRESPRFRELLSPRKGEILLVAALLHDVGHWPFCHPIEDLGLEGLPAHEAFAETFIGEGTELDQALIAHWRVTPAEIVQLLSQSASHPAGRLMRSILSGPIDIDKLDYLERDSLHSGVPYGRHFDKQRLIQSLVLNEAGDGLAITSKGKTAAELMVHSRYVMFSEVYWHHAVRSATSMFARAFFELRERVDLRSMFTDSDAGMIATLRAAAVGQPAAELLESVFGRRRALYKRAAEFSHLNEPAVYERFAGRPFVELVEVSRRLAERLRAALGQEVSEMQVLVDGPPPHREVEFAVDVYFPKEGVYRPLRSVSPMIDALARTSFDDYVKRVRVFVDPALIGTTRSAGMDDVWWRTAILASV
jgi:uncharacterized protein